MKFSIDLEQQGTIIKFNGTLSASDLLHAHDKLEKTFNFDSLSFTIWDYSNCDTSKVIPDSLSTLVEKGIQLERTMVAKYGLNSKFRIGLVTHDEHWKKINTLYITERTKVDTLYEIKIFDELSEALRWCKA